MRARGLFWSPHRLGGVLVFALLTLAGCAASTPDEALQTLGSHGAVPERRVAALNQLGPVARWPDPERAIDLLASIAWSDTQPDALRIAAIDRLIAHDEPAFRAAAHRWITRVDSWPVMHHVFDTAVGRGWTDFTQTAIRSYARPSQRYADAERPERLVIAALNEGRSVRDVLIETFAGLAPGVDEADQVAAWTVLNRLTAEGEADARAVLSSVPSGTPLVEDLTAAAGVLAELPRDAEGVLWLAALREREGGDWWRETERLIESLSPEQRAGLALRHLPVLAHVSEERRAAPGAVLLEELRRRLAGRIHVVREEEGALPGAASESLAEQAHRLAWGDLAVIHLVLDAMEDRQLVAQWFVQADADHLDTGSEHGGVLERVDEGFIARVHRPTLRDHDHKFISSNALIEAMYDGVAHYHFHAQRHENAGYAGPGAGDLAFVERLRPNALVLTFVDRRTLNVDYHQPGGIVIDLGLISR